MLCRSCLLVLYQLASRISQPLYLSCHVNSLMSQHQDHRGGGGLIQANSAREQPLHLRQKVLHVRQNTTG